MSSLICDCCGHDLSLPVYTPLNSKKNAVIYKCPYCSLVQSHYLGEPKVIAKIKAISTDADWGNVRHGKGIRFADARIYLDPILNQYQPSTVLDIGSNRGDFTKFALSKKYITKVVAVEPDKSLAPDYRSVEDLERLALVWERFENCILTEKFDFIYSSQTLEHANSARAMLEESYNLLSEYGLMYIEVPNIEIIGDQRGVEEFFIDKHTFHFEKQTLVNLAQSCGFSVAKDFETDAYNIKILFAKSSAQPSPLSLTTPSIDRILTSYPRILESNRGLLRALVESRLRPLSKRQKVAYWGANRIFDSLVKYGGLESEDVFMLVDTYMSGKLEQSHGIAIEDPNYIRVKEPQVCVVLARSSEDIVSSLAYDMGVRHVLKYSELLDQVSIGT